MPCRRACLLGIVLLLLSPGIGWSEGRESLRNLGDVAVFATVDGVAPSGLSEAVLQTDVELRLRRAGVNPDGKDGVLVAIVTVISDPPPSRGGNTLAYTYSVSVEFRRKMLLPADVHNALWNMKAADPLEQLKQQLTVGDAILRVEGCPKEIATVWSDGSIGYVGIDREPARLIRDKVADQVDSFINDFLAANPRATR